MNASSLARAGSTDEKKKPLAFHDFHLGKLQGAPQGINSTWQGENRRRGQERSKEEEKKKPAIRRGMFIVSNRCNPSRFFRPGRVRRKEGRHRTFFFKKEKGKIKTNENSNKKYNDDFSAQ